MTSTDIISRSIASDAFVITGQTMSEFYAAATRSKRGERPICTPRQAMQWVADWHAVADYLAFSAPMSLEAARGARDHLMNIYDAQLWALAKLSGLVTIVTEDTQGRTTLEGVAYVNPFIESFEITQIGL